MATSPRPVPALAGALLSDGDLDTTDHLLSAILRRTAGEITVGSIPAARRAIRHRLARRRRRLRHSLGTGTLAAGLVTGVTHQLWSRALLGPVAAPADATPPAAPPADEPAAVAPTPAAPTTPSSPSSPSSWTWDPDTGTDQVAADPAALYAAGTWHVYTTTATHCPAGVCTTYRVPRYTSGDLAEPARLAGDALPDLPAWVDPGHPEIWAPSVARVGDGYVLWFSATAARGTGTGGDGRTKCLGAAVASHPEGPFAPLPRPLRCAPGYWAIDPSPVSADGRWYLVWREDDAAHPTGRIVAAELTADGLALAAPGADPTTLLAGRQPWEDATPGPGIGPIENPALARHPTTGEWLLAWSANSWTTQGYATGLARCAGPLGPCQRLSDAEPWLRTDADVATPTDTQTTMTSGTSPGPASTATNGATPSGTAPGTSARAGTASPAADTGTVDERAAGVVGDGTSGWSLGGTGIGERSGAGFGGAGGLTFATGPDGQLYAVFHAYPGVGEHPQAVRAGWVARVEADPHGGPDRPYRLVAIGRNHSADPSVEGV